NGTSSSVQWGVNEDTPLVGDLDCDGKADLAVVREDGNFLKWYIRRSNGVLVFDRLFGLKDDTPFVGDLNGDGCDELVVVRTVAGERVWYYQNLYEGIDRTYSWGLAAHTLQPPFDMDGDGIDDLIV